MLMIERCFHNDQIASLIVCSSFDLTAMDSDPVNSVRE
jgi:hypothetical protein